MSFPTAQQAQIIRAHQRDMYHVASLREQTENVVRSWLGTRTLTRWDKEVELLVKLVYFGLTTGRATQTMGEEYTDIWQHSAFSRRRPSNGVRAALILLPTLPGYALSRWGHLLSNVSPTVARMLKALPTALEVATEMNLAMFYLRGTYYDLSKRLLGVKHISSLPRDPHTRPPSYSLLGILIAVRLIYRLISLTRPESGPSSTTNSAVDESKSTFLDDRAVSSLIGSENPEGDAPKPAEEDTGTWLDFTPEPAESAIPASVRASRNCTLCLEERTDSTATECGHLFCWTCIVGWGREKAECPLCRQSLSLTRLLPIYNL